VFNKDYATTKDEILKTKIHPRLESLDKFLGSNPFFLGYVTLADFKVYFLLKVLAGFGEGILDKHTNLLALVKSFEGQSELQTYLKSDRNAKKSVFPKAYAAWNSEF